MKNGLKILAGVMVLMAVVVGGYIGAFHAGYLGKPPQAGIIEGKKIPAPVIANRTALNLKAATARGVESDKQILFGDLHVHTTFSTDAFIWSLPMNGGTGPHPIADACDFARYCSALDFWAITDHAESITPRRWRETKQSMRTCQAVSGEGEDPDLISFTGFEWTQVGIVPEEHFGHKNVIFKDLDDASISTRPIAAAGVTLRVLRENQVGFPPEIIFADALKLNRYAGFNAFVEEVSAMDMCDENTPSSKLPESCTEVAATPAELIDKLDDQGLDPIIIPHGTTWGFYTPSGTTWKKALQSVMKPERFKLIEIFSGHGNAETYRKVNLSERKRLADGTFIGRCVPPTGDYMPSCWRAGEIIRERCLLSGKDAAECELRAVEGRDNYIGVGNAGHLTIPGVETEDWLNSSQCKDCFLPTFNMRFGTSVQASLATQGFDDNREKPNRFVWGFVGSSDNHRARPGTGYKAYQRLLNTESSGSVNQTWRERIFGKTQKPIAKSTKLSPNELLENVNVNMLEVERNTSFFTTGGLAGVHAEGRSRDEIWDAMQRRETFATSGPRILLWFDLVNGGPDGKSEEPMGAEVTMERTPDFRVNAVGSFVQAPGMPDFYEKGISKQRLQKICGGESYNPTNERYKIDRIEIVRIRPQTSPGQDISRRIDDPFLVKKCDGNADGCQFDFSDPEYADGKTDAIYYARAIQEATPTINADNLRCEYNAEGICVKVNPCFGDYRTDPKDNCLAPAEHRAWSSPIYLRRNDG
ncbi:MAG: DUF3604 domain-containing protein [Rhizobiaceae bacterium]|nr:DUF3604 domain-containing protein [Rhizobiaceae bacterium]